MAQWIDAPGQGGDDMAPAAEVYREVLVFARRRDHLDPDLPDCLTGAQRWVVAILRFYRRHLSSRVARTCISEPSCSSYAMRAVATNGIIVGGREASPVRMLSTYGRWRDPTTERLRCTALRASAVSLPTRQENNSRRGSLRRAPRGGISHSVFSLSRPVEPGCTNNTCHIVPTREQPPQATSKPAISSDPGGKQN